MEAAMYGETRNTINPKKFALWVGMASIIMLFAAFTSAYIVKQAGGNWLEFPMPGWFYASTAVILLSSGTLHYSYVSFKKENEFSYKLFLWITLALGLVFVVCQWYGWNELHSMGVDLKSNVSGSFTYLITGAHALHILSGLTAIIVALIHAHKLKFYYSKERKDRFELVLQYWHFLDILWVYLFVFLIVTR